jgi:hypothetical protein
LNEINKLDFDTEPPYAKILGKINDTLKSLGDDSVDSTVSTAILNSNNITFRQ